MAARLEAAFQGDVVNLIEIGLAGKAPLPTEQTVIGVYTNVESHSTIGKQLHYFNPAKRRIGSRRLVRFQSLLWQSVLLSNDLVLDLRLAVI